MYGPIANDGFGELLIWAFLNGSNTIDLFISTLPITPYLMSPANAFNENEIKLYKSMNLI
jgi:hypothetical protein